MRYGSPDVSFFLINGRDVVGALTDFDDKREARTAESHTLGDAWAEHQFVGVRDGEITQNGFYEDAARGWHDQLSTAGPGSTNILCYALQGSATGKGFVGWAGGVNVNYTRLAERDGLTKAKAVYRTTGPIEAGQIVRSWNLWAATGKTSANSIDWGQSSSNGGVGYIQWQAGTGEAIVRLLHSADGNTWATLAEFSKTVSEGHGAQRMTFTGGIDRYVCADYTTATATGKVGEFTAFVGLVRNATA